MIARKTKQLSIFGAVGLFFLPGVASAQDVAPGFAPGSIPEKPFSLLESPLDPDPVWTPPTTQAEVPPVQWTPPRVPQQPSPSDMANELLTPEVAQESSAPVLDFAPETPESVIEPPSLPTIGMEGQAGSFPTEPLQAPDFPGEVPEIPQAPEIMTGDMLMLDSSFGEDEFLPVDQTSQSSGVAQSIITDVSDVQPIGEAFQIAPRVKLGEAVRSKIIKADQPQLWTPVRNILGGANNRLAGNGAVHAVGQLTFLSFSRDYRGRGRQLSSGVPNLFANGPDEGDFTGVDINYGRRRYDGRGWEMRYIGFDPSSATDVSGGGPALVWGGLTPPLNDPATFGGAIPPGIPETFGLSGIGLGNFSAADIFADAQNHRVTRDSEFGSFEFNFLRASAGGSRLSCCGANVEFFAGLRGVSFNETTTFTAAATQAAVFPRSAFYSSEVENALFGLQIGGRLEKQLQKGWGYTFGTRVGVYNNRVESRQRAEYQFADGSAAVPQLLFGDDAGREFDFSGTDNELAFLGELDFGVTYQFRQRTRARFGFRGIAVTNVADAAGQFEDSLFDVDAVSEPKAFSDFIVGGFYFGVDHAF